MNDEKATIIAEYPKKMATRDLSFVPTDNPNPRRLTKAQIDHYNEQGYVMPLDIFDAQQARSNREYFDRILAQMNSHDDGRGTYAINGFQARCEGIYDIVRHPLILDYVEDLLGPSFVAWGTHYFCKLAHDPKHVAWHQDASYWPFEQSRTVTVWLAIDDADVENACMNFIPGTHKLGHLKWKAPDNPAVLDQQIVDVQQYGEPVADILKAGQISLHADMLAHGSGANTSDRRRCGLTIRYCPVSCRNFGGWHHAAVECRGVDLDDYWRFVPRPQGDDMSPLNKPKVIGGN